MFVGYTVRQPARATSAIRAESAAATLLEEREANLVPLASVRCSALPWGRFTGGSPL